MDALNPPAYALTLMVLTEEHHHASEGTGWYILGHAREANQGETIAAKRITVAQAEAIARSFGEVIPPNDEGTHPFEIVKKGSDAAKALIDDALKEAERIATTVETLRKNRGEFGE